MGNKIKILRFWPNWCKIVPFDAKSWTYIVCHICDVRVNYCLRSKIIIPMSQLWPFRSIRPTCRCLIHIYGKIFFVWLVVLNGIVWELFRQNRRMLIFCFYHRGFEKFDDPCPISRERNIWQVSCWNVCSLWSQEQFDMLGPTWHYSVILTLSNAHRGGHFEKRPLWRNW